MIDESSRSATGVPGLDEVLHGGLLAGRLYLIDGNPGAGKTTLALQYLLEGVRSGERCLYVTLSETNEELAAGAQSHGWSMDGIEVVEIIADDRQLAADEQLTMYHPSEIELSETTRRLLDAVESHRPQRMVLDSLSEVRLLAQSSLRYRRQILALKQFFAGRDCTVLLLDDRTSESSDLQLQSIAHGVISLGVCTPPYGRALRQLQVMKFRGSDFMSGFHDSRIRPGGLEVFPRLRAVRHGRDFPRETVRSGVEELDMLLGGGIDRGTATLMMGPPGTGKSSVALQFAAAAAARGDHAVVFVFEEVKRILLDRGAALGMTIAEGTGPGEILVHQIDPTEITPGEFVHLVRDEVEYNEARVIVIDSLNGYLNALPADRYLTAQLHELIAYLNNHGVATFLVAAQRGAIGNDLASDIEASYLADAIFLFRMFEHEGKVKKAVSVVKKRSGRHEESIRQMWFDASGIHLSEPLMRLRGVLTGVPIEIDEDDGKQDALPSDGDARR